ncbi:MAG: divergent PAP2 family protein [Bacillus sp. (in: Bacteria)]|nr:divergent PAP2 family protein [Bacillus sp. (in: firmicutes)]MCM1427271.1 divergent PAP2 family protein [Eubacterium sp.]
MAFLTGLIQNPVLVAGVLGWFVAQVLKTIIHLLITKQFVWERMVGSGGMPSSHSATVCALATAAGIQYGSESFAFAISVIMAIIVMHDAMGVRRETGIQARVLNEMMTLFREMGTKMSVEDKLKEFVGHTPLQVWIGALLGIVIGFLTCQFMLPI